MVYTANDGNTGTSTRSRDRRVTVNTVNDGNTVTAARSRDRRVIWSTQPMMETLRHQQDHETEG